MLNSDISRELEKIRLTHGGLLRPQDVVAFAKNPKTALHTQFDWDDKVAGEHWRLAQARAVIRVNVVVIGNNPTPVRAFVSLSPDRKTGGGYRGIADILGNEQLTKTMLEDAFDAFDALRRKYGHLQQLAGVWIAVDDAAKKPAAKSPRKAAKAEVEVRT